MLIGRIEGFVYSIIITLFGHPIGDVDHISLFLSTPTDDRVEISPALKPDLDYDKETFFIIHGFGEASNYTLYETLTETLVNTGVNVISVNWSPLSEIPNYVAAMSNVQLVGEFLGEYIVNHEFDLDKVEIIGFSLGAHVAGKTGKSVQDHSNGQKVKRIFGLDPAGPGYGLLDKIPKSSRLDRDDAKMVVTVMTNRFVYGTRFGFGRVNFMANIGFYQPGCHKDLPIFWCCHRRAIKFYTESLTSNGFVGRSKDGAELILSNGISETDEGDYTFYTNAEPPFARG